jgi:hypothetical protein
VTAFETHFLSDNPHAFHVRTDIQNVAVGHHERRFFAGFDGTEFVRDTCDLRRIKRNAFQRFVCRESERYGLRCVIRAGS